MVVPLRKRTKGWREENAFVIKGCGREGFKETFCDFKFSFQWLVRGFLAIFACDHAIVDAMNKESCLTIEVPYIFWVGFRLVFLGWKLVFEHGLRLSKENYSYFRMCFLMAC